MLASIGIIRAHDYDPFDSNTVSDVFLSLVVDSNWCHERKDGYKLHR